MSNIILILNAGSSSLKFSVFRAEHGDDGLLARGQVDGIGVQPQFVLRGPDGVVLEKRILDGDAIDHDDALALVFERIQSGLAGQRLVAVGHRVVHGGVKFASPVRIDENVLADLEQLIPLAPLHQPHNLAAIRSVSRRDPNVPQVACFDTAFHRTQPEVAQRFALPRRFMDEGVRRYGFHGLSYEYIASILPSRDPKAAKGRTIVAHLGNGASMCAMLGCKSIATTMSFTPADGLVMGTRCGAIDPGVLLYLMTRHAMSAAEIEHLIYHESGLLGVSAMSSDMRSLLTSDDAHAAEAIDLFVYRIVRELGSLAAALGGLDALIFTGGIGENAADIRARVSRASSWLGVRIGASANKTCQSCISTADSAVSVWVIPTNEELMIAEHTRRLLGR